MTEDDRALIEAAARAVNLPECGWMAETFTYVKDNTFTSWEPLTVNSDAFELAAALQIDTWHRPGHVGAGHPHKGVIQSYEAEHTDRATATRRAIVRAAASLLPDGGPR